MPNLSLLQKTQIVTLLEEGRSIRALAQRFEVNKSTILRAKRKWQQERVVLRKNGSGRKRVTTPEDDENLIQFLRNNPFESVVTAINRTNFPGHVRTARNRVREDSELPS
ncbi:Helix-turn-helix domain [Popillia japonica]|uniref:Helix-turn-helix domain n=1 Tax=Popillia japonica TaxID=7064 RepID=A0AAW1HX82_POPJA